MDKDVSPGSSSRRGSKRAPSSVDTIGSKSPPSSSTSSSLPSSSSLDDTSHIWDCSVCTYRNSAEAFKCSMCDVRKGTSTRKPRINPDIVAQQVARQQEQIKQQAIKAVKLPKNIDKTKLKDNNDITTPGSSKSNNSTPGTSPVDTKKVKITTGETGTITSDVKLPVPVDVPSPPLPLPKKSPKKVKKNKLDSDSGSVTTPGSSKAKTHPSPGGVSREGKKSKTISAKAKLKNVDRNNAQVKAVTVNNVTVFITEFPPKKKEKVKGEKDRDKDKDKEKVKKFSAKGSPEKGESEEKKCAKR